VANGPNIFQMLLVFLKQLNDWPIHIIGRNFCYDSAVAALLGTAAISISGVFH